jgi:hypothetical protein
VGGVLVIQARVKADGSSMSIDNQGRSMSSESDLPWT